MKNILKLTALCAAFGLVSPLSASMRDDRRDCSNSCFKSTLCDIKHLIEDLSACGQSISIGKEDIGTTGYVIDKPGNYCLKEDVVFNPANPTTFVPVTFLGDGSGAAGFAAVSNSMVRGVFMTANGSGYTTATPVFGNALGGSGAAGSSTISGGEVQSVSITSAGSGYTDTVQAAITVKSSGVRISFNGNRLVQAGAVKAANIPAYSGVNNPSSQAPFVVGILIPDMNPTGDVTEVDLESIYVDGGDGIINGFSMWGVYCQGHVADVQLSNLTIENCGALASYYLRPFPSYFPNGNPLGLYPIAGTVPMAVGAISIGETDLYGMGPYFFTQSYGVAQNRVSNVSINNVSCLNSFLIGLNAANTTNMYIANSHFDNAFCDDPNNEVWGAGFGIADMNYEDPNVMNLVVENSTFNNTSFNGDFTTELTSGYGAKGCSQTRGHNFTFSNCHFDGTKTTFACDEIAAVTFGFANSDVHDGTWENCTFSNITALGGINAFHASGIDSYDDAGQTRSSENIRLINCVASNLQQIGNQQKPAPVLFQSDTFPPLGGFVTYFAKNVYFENCIASDLICYGPADQDSGITGFFNGPGQVANPEFEAVNYVYNGCIAQRVMAVNGGTASGFWMAPYYPTWDLRTMSFDGCIAEGCQSMIPTYTINPQTLQPYNNTQGAGIGFWFNSEYLGENDFPVSYTNCKALHNKGATVVIDPFNDDEGNQYSAGFFANASTPGFPLQNHTYYNCEATDNVYGFIFQNVNQMVVRNCRSDLNVASTTNTSADGTVGEGYTDLGQNQLVITTTIASVTSPTVFNLVLEGTSDVDGSYVGDVILFTYSYTTGVITNYVGATREVTILFDPFIGPPAPGEYVSIYTLPTPAAPGQSFSLFESNRAFANGAGYTDFGTNGNYNVIYGSGAEADFVPTLTGNLTHKTAIGGSFFPEANFIAHNLSITIA